MPSFFRVCAAVAIGLLATVHASPLGERATYNNPIKPGSGADPWMIQIGDAYYLTYTTGGDVQITKAANIAGPWPASGTSVFTPPSNLKEVWAPELHQINGAFYIYTAMDDGNNNNHRMYVLKGSSATDPQKPFDLIGKISSPDNNWAIDGTVLQYQNGQLYFIWSGWSDGSHTNTQNLYIAHMSSPTTIDSNRVVIHEPKPSWQQSMLGSNRMGVNEGPATFVNEGRTFLIYSAAGSWSDDYCLAFMGIDGGADPMVAKNWWRYDDRAVLSKSNAAFGPGHASFLKDRSGTPYVVYHADEKSGAGWNGRTIRTQSFGFNPDHSPAFAAPAGFNAALPMPA